MISDKICDMLVYCCWTEDKVRSERSIMLDNVEFFRVIGKEIVKEGKDIYIYVCDKESRGSSWDSPIKSL